MIVVIRSFDWIAFAEVVPVWKVMFLWENISATASMDTVVEREDRCWWISFEHSFSEEVPTETSTWTESTTADHPVSQVEKDLGRLGNTCTTDYYCRRLVTQSHCYNGKCTCLDGFIASDSFTCIPGKCRWTLCVRCSLFSLFQGSREDTATMPAHYKSLLGGQCSSMEHCQTMDARCLDNICTCRNGYFAIDDWNCLQDPGKDHSLSFHPINHSLWIRCFFWRSNNNKKNQHHYQYEHVDHQHWLSLVAVVFFHYVSCIGGRFQEHLSLSMFAQSTMCQYGSEFSLYSLRTMYL